jgi:hypothetical protein
VAPVPHWLDHLDDGALHNYLTGTAADRAERFVLEQEGDRWVAEFRAPTPLTGEIIPTEHGAIVVPEGGSLKVEAGDPRTAMLALADLVARNT